jgi:hypothetical protein
MALDSRFQSTCCKRVASATMRFLGLCGRSLTQDGGFDQLAQVDGLAIELQLTGGDAAHIQQFRDHLRLHAGVFDNDGETSPQDILRVRVLLL